MVMDPGWGRDTWEGESLRGREGEVETCFNIFFPFSQGALCPANRDDENKKKALFGGCCTTILSDNPVAILQYSYRSTNGKK